MNLLSSKILSLLFFIFITFNANAFEVENIIFQHAGDIGKYSIGSGKQINKYYSLSFHYGFVPANEIQSKIETYTVKNNLHVFGYDYKNHEYSLYTGISVYYFPNDKYQTSGVSEAPDDYYRQSQVRGQIYIGNRLTFNQKHSIYTESGINDLWVINSSNNDSIDYKDHVVLGIGYTYTF